MLKYDIDTTENGYNNISGEAQDFTELKNAVLVNGELPDLVGSVTLDDPPAHTIWLAAQKGLGMYIAVNDENGTALSLHDRDALNETVDVWDELYVSRGLFLPVEIALKALEEYITNGILSADVEWITPDDIPEDGNFIN